MVAILDSTGTAVVNYTYDAWGNPLSRTGSMATTLGALNPLRYRGYIYDEETGLYYLQSRYYDPWIGRFINADAFAATGQGLLGNNMFTYCNNNPVMFSDDSGTRPILSLSVSAETLEEKKASFGYMQGKRASITKSPSALGIVKELATSIYNNLEFSAGVGQGLEYKTTLLDVVGIQVGMHGNYASVKLEDGEWLYGQELNSGISLSLLWYNFGFNEYIFTQDGITTIRKVDKWLYGNETLTIFSVAVYPMAGFSASVGFDIIQFCSDLDSIF